VGMIYSIYYTNKSPREQYKLPFSLSFRESQKKASFTHEMTKPFILRTNFVLFPHMCGGGPLMEKGAILHFKGLYWKLPFFLFWYGRSVIVGFEGNGEGGEYSLFYAILKSEYPMLCYSKRQCKVR
jgi:hypothetical protein